VGTAGQDKLRTVDGAMARLGVFRVALIELKISVVCSHNGGPDESPALLFFPLLRRLAASAPLLEPKIV
jgi:hypothetical protein